MIDPKLRKQLERLVELGEKVTPGPWNPTGMLDPRKGSSTTAAGMNVPKLPRMSCVGWPRRGSDALYQNVVSVWLYEAYDLGGVGTLLT